MITLSIVDAGTVTGDTLAGVSMKALGLEEWSAFHVFGDDASEVFAKLAR